MGVYIYIYTFYMYSYNIYFHVEKSYTSVLCRRTIASFPSSLLYFYLSFAVFKNVIFYFFSLFHALLSPYRFISCFFFNPLVPELWFFLHARFEFWEREFSIGGKGGRHTRSVPERLMRCSLYFLVHDLRAVRKSIIVQNLLERTRLELSEKKTSTNWCSTCSLNFVS